MTMALCVLCRSTRPPIRRLGAWSWTSSWLHSAGTSTTPSSWPCRRGTPLGFPSTLCPSYAFSTDVGRSEKFQLEEYWAPVSAAVNMALGDAVPVGYPEKIHESMRYSIFSAGAKMCCPVMCVAACELVGGSRDRVLPVACALEMIHTASLIHDDLPCMDNVSVHGGHPANHAVYGEDVAILAGDALLGLAFQHIVEATEGVPPERVLRVVRELSRAVGSKGMAGGQLLDLIAAGNADVDPSLLEYIHLHKSALVAECSLVGGAVVGGASDDDVERLRSCGRAVGLMYQIVEEVRRAELEQAAGGHMENSKATYPRVHGMDRSREIVQELRRSAKQCLSQFDEKRARPLLSFVDYAATRRF